MVRGQQTTEETLLVTLLLREWDRISEFMCCFFREPCWVCYSGTLTSPLCGFHTDTSIHTDTRTHTKSCYHLVKQPLGSHNTVS